MHALGAGVQSAPARPACPPGQEHEDRGDDRHERRAGGGKLLGHAGAEGGLEQRGATARGLGQRRGAGPEQKAPEVVQGQAQYKVVRPRVGAPDDCQDAYNHDLRGRGPAAARKQWGLSATGDIDVPCAPTRPAWPIKCRQPRALRHAAAARQGQGVSILPDSQTCLSDLRGAAVGVLPTWAAVRRMTLPSTTSGNQNRQG